jgi:hypothetical protein
LLTLALAGCASAPLAEQPGMNMTQVDVERPRGEFHSQLSPELLAQVQTIAKAAIKLEDFNALDPIASANPDLAPDIAATAIQAVLEKSDNGDSYQKVAMIVQTVVATVPSKVAEIVKACIQVVPPSNVATTRVRAAAANSIHPSSQ